MTVFAADKTKLFDFLGRAFIAFLFAQAVPGKVAGFPSTVEFIVSRGIPEPLAAFLATRAVYTTPPSRSGRTNVNQIISTTDKAPHKAGS